MAPGATQAQLTAQFDEEAQRLSELVLQRFGGGQGDLVRNWKAEHPGPDPDVMTTHQLIAQAEHDSREAVLTEELYSQVPEISEEQIARELKIEQRIEAEIAAKRQARDPDRWRTSMVEIPPSETFAPAGSEIQMVGESADRVGLDRHVSVLTWPRDVDAGTCPDVGLAVHADGGGVGRGDESLTVGLDVAVAVREDDGVVFCADSGVVGADNATLAAGIDGAVVERFDVSMFVGGDPGVVGRLDEAPAGGCDGAAGDSRAGLSDNFDLDLTGDVTEVQPVLRVGVDDDAFRSRGEALGVFRIAADRRCGAATIRPT
ncbi:hypothetical protein [Rhodococcus koreensis]